MGKSVETVYKGTKFPNRLHARWAVFFHHLNIDFKYGGDPITLSDGTIFTPEFWAIEKECWIDVQRKDATLTDLANLRRLADETGHTVLLIQGSPSAPYGYNQIQSSYRVSAMIGTFKDNIRFANPNFEDFRWESLAEHLKENGYAPPTYDGTYESALQLVRLDQDYFLKTYGRNHPNWAFDIWMKELLFFDSEAEGPGLGFIDANFFGWSSGVLWGTFSDELEAAFAAARAEQFEDDG
jgi:hypothetical protein